jgi:hypothetical protein
MREKTSQGIHLLLAAAIVLLGGCDRREALTPEKAKEIVSRYQFSAEPIYAEVPQRVWWSDASPRDEYDGKALETLRNLERAGLLTVTESHGPNGIQEYRGKVTAKGFPLLGTAPSMRGPVFRAKIAEKRYDGLRNFERHPNDPTIGHGELVWHYGNPTPMYDLFTTKIDKPLNTPFASLVSFFYKDHEWHFDINVKKTRAAV